MSRFLDLVNERVVVYDGATATNLQELGLEADDFGGPELEGCTDILSVTRPDVIADLHESFFRVGSDVVETNTFGAFAVPLGEYAIPERAHEICVASARIAREVAGGYGGLVAGSMGPGTKSPSLGQIGFVELRDAYEVMARGLIEGGVDLLITETHFDLLGAKAAVIGARRAMAALGRQVPIQLQVTMEQTGTMLLGTEIGAALTALGALRPDVFGLNCATGPSEMHEHLRHLSANATMPISCLPNMGLPSVVDGKMHYDLSPERVRRVPDPVRHRAGRAGGGRLLRVHAGAPPPPRRRGQGPDAGPPRPPPRRAARRRCSTRCRSTRTPASSSSASAPTPTAPRSSGTRCWPATGTRASVSPATRSARAPTCSTCASTTWAATARSTWTRSPAGSAPRSPCPLVLDSTEPQVIEAGLQRLGGRAILNSANLEDGEAEGSRFDRVCSLAREYGAAVVCLLIDEEGQARDVEWKLRVAHRIHDLATDPLRAGARRPHLRRPHVPALDRRRGPAPRRHEHDRGDPPHQGRAARRVHDARRLQRQLRPVPGGPPRPQLGVPARVRRGGARLGHRPRRPHHAAQQDPRPPAQGVPRPGLRPARPTAAGLRPAGRAARRVRRRRRWPRPRRRTAAAGRSTSGSSPASSTATATG